MNQVFKHSRCEHTVKPIMTIGKSPLYVGSATEYKYYVRRESENLGLTVCLNKGSQYTFDKLDIMSPMVSTTEMLLPYTQIKHPGTHYFSIDWPDRGAIDLPAQFWTTLIAFITDKVGTETTWIHCIGGHGRTGTALSIIAYMLGKCGKMDPVEWVRKNYCKECVESDVQIEYIEDILNINVTAKIPTVWDNLTAKPSTYNFQQSAFGSGTNNVTYPNTVASQIYTYSDIPNDIETSRTLDRLVDEILAMTKKAETGDAISQKHIIDEKVYFISNKKGYRAAWGTPVHRTLRTAEAILQIAFDEARHPQQFV